MAEAEDFLTKLEANIAGLAGKLARLRAAKPIDQLSIDEVYEMRPELRDSFIRAMEQDNWSTEEESPEEAQKSPQPH